MGEGRQLIFVFYHDKKQMNQISFMTICFDGAAARFSAGVMIDVWRVLF